MVLYPSKISNKLPQFSTSMNRKDVQDHMIIHGKCSLGLLPWSDPGGIFSLSTCREVCEVINLLICIWNGQVEEQVAFPSHRVLKSAVSLEFAPSHHWRQSSELRYVAYCTLSGEWCIESHNIWLWEIVQQANTVKGWNTLHNFPFKIWTDLKTLGIIHIPTLQTVIEEKLCILRLEYTQPLNLNRF